MPLIIGGSMLASGLLGSKASGSAAKSQKKAASNALMMQQQQMNANAPWLERGNEAADYLQDLMGLGSNDSYEDLINKYSGQFTTYVKKKSGGGGLKGALKGAASGFTDPASMAMGAIAGAKGGGKYTGYVDQPKLEAFVRQKMAEQKAKRESSQFGSLMKDFDNSMFVKDPGYDFRQREGNKGIQGSLAAQGGLFSGKAGKALARYNQDFASNEFGNAYNRYQQNRATKYNQLAGIAGTGQQAQQFGAGLSGQMGNTLMDRANASAAGTMGRANALSGALGSGLNYWQQKQYIDKVV